eukprot:Blabericola_migrator_1__3431@NODE_200_length_11466_cov_45_966751_g172_i0_p4_GENE_NODE_200_length_11466_cov_45_966751_g172_i0NODE_200_length_11466_cov_45_966751_g172_i0_p4_ORF_typecomplete_len306_score51_89Spermine_synth/PF01564_17/5_7e50Spermine_synt_N/PF17284_2/2_9e18Methyltransf_23/PF13489_6/9_1e05MTS/PF05175_14/0_041MTS/PF05175_14/24Methyltransf_31/PF13847_6/0_086Methyltransf_31/PF13847_6/1_9e02Methyltransf_30/PF05430_11/0_026Pyr_redox_2/PF07992_14/0_033Methyltransf_25/PF13649_6/0_68Methyltra
MVQTVVNRPADQEGFWVSEESDFESHGFAQSFKCRRLVHEERSQYQAIQIFETTNFGNLMVLDGVFQNTEVDEFAYHEMMCNVPLFAHPNPKRVLVVGGGDCGVVREIARHSGVETIHLAEIDGRVVELSKQYFPGIMSACEDPRLEIKIVDGAKYLETPELESFYDVIIVDSSDPIGPNQSLFRESFYRDIKRCLAPGGFAVCQGENFWLHPRTIREVMKKCGEIFPEVNYYWFSIPVYPMGCIGAVALSKDKGCTMSDVHPSRLEAANRMTEELRYYNTAVHRAAFAKPTFFQKGLELVRRSD